MIQKLGLAMPEWFIRQCRDFLVRKLRGGLGLLQLAWPCWHKIALAPLDARWSANANKYTWLHTFWVPEPLTFTGTACEGSGSFKLSAAVHFKLLSQGIRSDQGFIWPFGFL